MLTEVHEMCYISQKQLAFLANMAMIIINNTPHASRKICAPWGVTFFSGVW